MHHESKFAVDSKFHLHGLQHQGYPCMKTNKYKKIIHAVFASSFTDKMIVTFSVVY